MISCDLLMIGAFCYAIFIAIYLIQGDGDNNDVS